MVRNYDPDRPVPPEVIERILDHAIRAPSAGFSQGWAFLVLEAPADRAAFWAATTPVPLSDGAEPAEEQVLTPSRWLRGMSAAPLIIVPLSHRAAYLSRYAEPDKGWTDRDEARWPVPYWHIDTGMAALMILLTAVDEGLGACFFGIMPQPGPDFDATVEVPAHTNAFRAEFGIPAEYDPIGGITVGYRAADTPPQSPLAAQRRRDTAEVIHRGQWGQH
jgi:nitroreductase